MPTPPIPPIIITTAITTVGATIADMFRTKERRRERQETKRVEAERMVAREQAVLDTQRAERERAEADARAAHARRIREWTWAGLGVLLGVLAIVVVAWLVFF